jgi:hypothetical protein
MKFEDSEERINPHRLLVHSNEKQQNLYESWNLLKPEMYFLSDDLASNKIFVLQTLKIFERIPS